VALFYPNAKGIVYTRPQVQTLSVPRALGQ
jgi:hypothetical protein